MQYIKRTLESEILNLSNKYLVIFIIGPRQSGRTTMLKKLIEDEKNGWEYVSLANLDERL